MHVSCYWLCTYEHTHKCLSSVAILAAPFDLLFFFFLLFFLCQHGIQATITKPGAVWTSMRGGGGGGDRLTYMGCLVWCSMRLPSMCTCVHACMHTLILTCSMWRRARRGAEDKFQFLSIHCKANSTTCLDVNRVCRFTRGISRTLVQSASVMFSRKVPPEYTLGHSVYGSISRGNMSTTRRRAKEEEEQKRCFCTL